MRSVPSASQRRWYGVVGIASVAVLVITGILAYQGTFFPTVPVTLQADRAGLIMEPGSQVLLRGVRVGTVESVEPDGQTGAVLRLGLARDAVDHISADAGAAIDPSTVFGPKAVALQTPDGRPTVPIQSNDVIQTHAIATEFNELFRGVHNALSSVEPAKLNATLGALAQVLEGRGSRVGGYVSQLGEYLGKLNSSLPTVRGDITAAADVTDGYANAAADLLDVAQNTTVTSNTLTETQATLHAVLLDATHTAGDAEEFLGRVERPLGTALDALRPTTRLLAEYSPEYTCLLQGMNKGRKIASRFIGNKLPAVQARISFVPGQQPYENPRDLPKLVTGLGPDCYHGPNIPESDMPTPRYTWDDGTKEYWSNSDNTVTLGDPPLDLYSELFGREAAGELSKLQEGPN